MNIFIVLGSLLLGYGIFTEIKNKKSGVAAPAPAPAPAAPKAKPAEATPPEVDPLKNVQTP